MIVRFKEVGIHVEKSGICPSCGKRASRQQYIYQTLSPFNKNSDGTMKSSQDIQKENTEKYKLWKKEPVYHAKCEEDDYEDSYAEKDI